VKGPLRTCDPLTTRNSLVHLGWCGVCLVDVRVSVLGREHAQVGNDRRRDQDIARDVDELLAWVERVLFSVERCGFRVLGLGFRVGCWGSGVWCSGFKGSELGLGV
jgi:hypothetical protein